MNTAEIRERVLEINQLEDLAAQNRAYVAAELLRGLIEGDRMAAACVRVDYTKLSRVLGLDRRDRR